MAASSSSPSLVEAFVLRPCHVRVLFEVRSSQGRAVTDISDIARLATFGAVDTVLVDVDASVPGSIEEDTGVASVALPLLPSVVVGGAVIEHLVVGLTAIATLFVAAASWAAR